MRFRVSEHNVSPQEELFTEKLTIHQKTVNNCSIKVVGVGGAGCKTVNLMIKGGQHFTIMPEISFITINTDKQDLISLKAGHKVQIGIKLTNGMGSGGKPEIGKQAIEENYEDVKQVLNNIQQAVPVETKVVFIVCGMGGGTGTGASPVIAKMAKEDGAFVVGVVTSPFYFEGDIKIQQANEGIYKLKKYTDALINIPNQKLFTSSDEVLTQIQALDSSKENPFIKANRLLIQVIQELVELILYPGLVNVDFADVCAIIREPGETGVGIGSARGEDRALKSVKQAISSQMLTERGIKKATGILVNITSGNKLTFKELQEIFLAIRENMRQDTNMIFGIRVDDKMQDELKVTMIAGGIRENRRLSEKQNLRIPAYKRKNIHMFPGEGSIRNATNFKQESIVAPTYVRRNNNGSNSVA